MPSFAIKQRPDLRRATIHSVDELCRDIKTFQRKKNVRRFFKEIALSLVSLMGNSELPSDFSHYGTGWLVITAKYLDNQHIIGKGDTTESWDRIKALSLLRCHLLACFFRDVPYTKSCLKIANEIDEKICNALGRKNIYELLQ